MNCCWENNFAELLVKVSEKLQASSLSAVKISKNEQFVNSQEVMLDIPVGVCDQFGYKYVCLLCMEETVNETSSSDVPRHNAFEVMTINRKITLPPRIGLPLL